jgi:TolB-like protein
VNAKNFFSELKRRNVYKVAIAYGVVAWLLMQVASQIFPFFEIPNWAVRLVVLLLIIGFPIALILAWAFELTPEGLKRTEVADAVAAPHFRGRAWIYVVIIACALSLGLFFLGRYTVSPTTSAEKRRPPATAESLPEKSIAVLPFENLSGDPTNAYFTEGVQEEILTRLSKIADLKVISRTSTQRFKSSPDNLPQIAKQLGVANILEGSVQKAADKVRVSVQLVNAASDAHLWAESFDRKLTDIFAVETDIAKAIADTLRVRLTGAERQQLAKRPTANLKAFQYYMQGRSISQRRTREDLLTAVQYYERAIEEDGNYALAYAGLSDAYSTLGVFGYIAPVEGRHKGEEAA